MTPAITFALISLAAAGCLDITFKKFSRKERSRGMYLFGCGAVWLTLQLIYLGINDTVLEFSETTIVFGAIAGLMVAMSNILLIESMTGLDASLGSTIYRLNTIGVVVISVLLLGEDFGVLKLSGIAIGIFGVAMLYRRSPETGEVVRSALFFLILAITAATFRAIYGVVTKSGLEEGALPEGMLVIAACCWVVGGLAYAALRERRVRMTGKKAVYALVSGVLCFAVVNSLIEALRLGEASVVIPIANLSFVVTLLIAFGLGMESLNARKYAAICCAAISVFLLAQTV